jgi:hypothetical protein
MTLSLAPARGVLVGGLRPIVRALHLVVNADHYD